MTTLPNASPHTVPQTTEERALVKSTPHLDYILLDGSGSMSDKWWEMLQAIDDYIAGIKAERINTRIILSIFDSTDIDYKARDQVLANWTPLMVDPVGANWGTTPLYDAINVMGRAVTDHGAKTTHVIIATDGGENGSKVTDRTQAKAILDYLRAQGAQITFIGADFNNSAEAAKLGATPDTAIGVEKRRLSDATKNLAEKRAKYALFGTPMSFTEDERQQFGGYLAAPPK